MISLAAAQIETVMNDGDESVQALTDSFTQIVGDVRDVQRIAESLDGADAAKQRVSIINRCRGINANMSSAIVAFQFYDRLSQRLTHVVNSLSSLADLVADQTRLFNPSEWRCLQEQIRSRYTIAQDLAMFDALMQGSCIEEALAVWRNTGVDRGNDSHEVELF